MCPVLEYGSSVWDPQSTLLQEELEKVQKKAARFVIGNYIYETGSMTDILEQLKWESLKKRRRDSRYIMLYKGLKGATSIPMNDLVPPIRHVRKHNSLAFQTHPSVESPWTQWTLSCWSIGMVVHGHCPLSPWTVSTGSLGFFPGFSLHFI